MLFPSSPLLAIAVVITLVAAVTDLRKGKISNWVSLGGVVLGIGLHGVFGYFNGSWTAAGSGSFMAALGAVLCGGVPLLLWRWGALGGGDAKLLAAVGALCGPVVGLEVQFYAFSIALLYAGAKLSFRGQLFRLVWNGVVVAAKLVRRKELKRRELEEVSLTMRFAPAVCAATLLVMAARAGS